MTLDIQQPVDFIFIKSNNRPVVDQGYRNTLLAGPSYHIPGRLLIPCDIHFLEADIVFSKILFDRPAPGTGGRGKQYNTGLGFHFILLSLKECLWFF
jgi:hypothetical protein